MIGRFAAVWATFEKSFGGNWGFSFGNFQKWPKAYTNLETLEPLLREFGNFLLEQLYAISDPLLRLFRKNLVVKMSTCQNCSKTLAASYKICQDCVPLLRRALPNTQQSTFVRSMAFCVVEVVILLLLMLL